jgi:hypothetical protein
LPEPADVHPSITPERIIDALERGIMVLDNPGFCLHCGTDADRCEPDARHYKCDSCGFLAVFGAEEVLVMIA